MSVLVLSLREGFGEVLLKDVPVVCGRAEVTVVRGVAFRTDVGRCAGSATSLVINVVDALRSSGALSGPALATGAFG